MRQGESCCGKPDKTEWERMLGRAYSPASLPRKGEFTMESTVEEMRRESLMMKLMYFSTKMIFKVSCKNSDPDDPEYKMLMKSSVGSPLRSMYISGGMAGGLFPGMLDIANGRFFRGVGKMLSKK